MHRKPLLSHISFKTHLFWVFSFLFSLFRWGGLAIRGLCPADYLDRNTICLNREKRFYQINRLTAPHVLFTYWSISILRAQRPDINFGDFDFIQIFEMTHTHKKKNFKYNAKRIFFKKKSNTGEVVADWSGENTWSSHLHAGRWVWEKIVAGIPLVFAPLIAEFW